MYGSSNLLMSFIYYSFDRIDSYRSGIDVSQMEAEKLYTVEYFENFPVNS